MPSKTAKELQQKLHLRSLNVEGKASCWLLATLYGIAGALDNALKPSVKDRLLDCHLRRVLWQQVATECLTNFQTLDTSHAAQLIELLTNLHQMPYQGKRRSGSSPESVGWRPASGWGGTVAFDYVCRRENACAFELAAAPASNL